jgi:beta-carotene ketolase (CrtW type)
MIMLLWGGHLYYILEYVSLNIGNPMMYVHILVQSYLYTGLFITAHDAMHGSIAESRWVNKAFGYTASLLFAGMWFPKLKENHKLHHQYPAEKRDPDYYTGSQNFFVWWGNFMVKYLTVFQLVIMAAAFNLLLFRYEEIRVILFWVLPAIVGTLQLFIFGTWLPHRLPHTDDMMPHRARSQRKNHLLAMLSCYFFGYHKEHHDSPRPPWWKLYQLR